MGNTFIVRRHGILRRKSNTNEGKEVWNFWSKGYFGISEPGIVVKSAKDTESENAKA